MTKYQTSIVEFQDYSINMVDQEIERLSSEGYAPIHFNSHYEPINCNWKMIIVFKLKPMAEAINCD